VADIIVGMAVVITVDMTILIREIRTKTGVDHSPRQHHRLRAMRVAVQIAVPPGFANNAARR